VKDKDADEIIALVAKKLKARREELGYSVNRTAQLAGISHVGLLQFEGGERSPQLRTVLKVADALGVPLPDLFRREG